MALYLILYDIGSTGNVEDRYRSLQEAIREESDDVIWAETPNAAIISSKKSVQSLAYTLHIRTLFSTVHDKMVVIGLSKKNI